ncbi:hypothetical protein [Anaerosporobacter sp.]|uniref:hypothetical protein n=1 Tax=Anaerosporobacter sp. TaxID=1872529 RepID=UPI00286F7C86|nr:hypothetical protein [Anaerosporobacter sp.]
MIGICSKCGNHNWDKEVMNGQVKCPKCGDTWKFNSLPLYILTGCSGIGKTTTGIEIMKKQMDVVVLDADMFYNIMPGATEEDYYAQVEQLESLSKNIMQSGKPVLWTMAGNLDKLKHTYNSRFFSDIHCLALVCDEDALRSRMTEGRGIVDEGWIKSSIDYNNYFKTHTSLGDTEFDIYDTSEKSMSEVSDYVIGWMKRTDI